MHWTRLFRPLGPVWTPLFRASFAPRSGARARSALYGPRSRKKMGVIVEPKTNLVPLVVYTKESSSLLVHALWEHSEKELFLLYTGLTTRTPVG